MPRIPYDRLLILIILALLGFGLAMVFSASSVVSRELYGSQSSIFTRQLAAVGLGLILMFTVMRIDYHNYDRKLLIYGLLAVTFVGLVIPFFGPPKNGAHRWISLGPATFQPSEMAKLAVVLFTAYLLSTRPQLCRSFMRGLLPYFLVVGGVILLVLAGPDLGTALAIGATAGLLLFYGGLSLRYIGGALLLAAPLFYLLILNVPYRRTRILAFLNPLEDRFGSGYQVLQSLIAVGSGGWTGLGYAEGKQKLLFLPEPHTDFIFAVVGEELGLLGSLVLVILFGLFFWRGVRIALRADSPFGTYIALGIVSMVVVQALINMSVVVSLIPTKGIPLPFVSVGGSSMLVMLAAAGMLLNVSRHARHGRPVEA